MDKQNQLINQFDAAGIRVEIQADSRHFKLYYKGLIAGYWPNTGTCYIFGKSFKPSVEGLIKALKSGRIKMPVEASEATCKSCGESIWWIKTLAGKNMPLNASGESHWGTCPSADAHRKPAPARPAVGGRR